MPLSNSGCEVYTFVSPNGSTIPQPSIDSLNQTGDYTIFPIQQGCTDDDQIFAQHNFHVCRYGELPDIPITQFDGCPLVNGGFTKINGYYEEYYNTCGGSTSSNLTEANSTRCAGSVGLIAYDFTSSLSSAVCVLEPVYTLDGSTVIMAPDAPLRVVKASINGNPPVVTGGCNISDTQNGFPSQLFRVTRYAYDSSTNSLTLNNSGSFVKITHRPTGNCIAPYTLGTDGKTPSISSFNPNKSPILVDPTSFNNVGAWWYITPSLSQPADEVAQLPDPNGKLFALPQLVWMPNPSAIGSIQDPVLLWDYLTDPANNVFSLIPFRVVGLSLIFDVMSMRRFITYAPGLTLPTILPPTNPSSPYYATLQGGKAYANNFRFNTNSKCFGYNPSLGGLPVQIGSQTIIVPLSQTSACYAEYNSSLIRSYLQAIFSAYSRVIAEAAAFNYIDLNLLPIILNGVSNFYNI
jgi:hypothetical protein